MTSLSLEMRSPIARNGPTLKVDHRLDLFLSLMGMPLSLFKYTFDSEDPAGELILYRHCHGSFSRVLMRRVRGDVVASLEVNPPSATIRFAGSGNEIATIPYLLHGPPTFAQARRDHKRKPHEQCVAMVACVVCRF